MQPHDRTAQARQTRQDQQQALVNKFPEVGRSESSASQMFIRAFNAAGNDPRKALAIARAVLGGMAR